MPRSKDPRKNEHPELTFDRLTKWASSGDSSAEGIADWDIKRDAFCDALFAMLGDGLAVWLGTTRDGGTLCVTLVDGENKRRTYLSDSISWDDYWDGLARVAQRGGTPKTPASGQVVPIREVGD